MENDLKERGGCLSLWLAYSLITSYVAAITGLSLALWSLYINEQIRGYLVAMSDTLLLYVAISFAAFISVTAMVNWKKWGFYSYVVCTLALCSIALSVGMPLSRVLIGSSGIIVLSVLMIERWQYFD